LSEPENAAPSPPEEPPTPKGTESSNRSVMIVLSYLWILALIPFLVVKDDEEVQWHAKNGLVLLAAEILFGIATTVVGVGCLIALLTPLISLAVIALHVVCIVKGLKGERLVIPGVSQFADRF